MIRIGIIGATGYVGVELIRLLHGHPQVSGIIAGSVSHEAKSLSEIYPNFASVSDLVLGDIDTVLRDSDVIFASVPHGLSEAPARRAFDSGKLFIDLGADFRLEDESMYAAYYHGSFKDPALHSKAVYGLPELNRERLKAARIIANPGCYPTCSSLGLFPALRSGIAGEGSIMIDALSGLSGAGRSLTLDTHFVECDEAVAPYKVTTHRHRPEIAQNLAAMAGRPVPFAFVPHLVPMSRGMLCTSYVPLVRPVGEDVVREIFATFYKDEPFVRVRPAGETVSSRWVRYSNYCDISVHVDAEANTLIVASALDNMVKGAAGQAIQSMNIACGFGEAEGLTQVPPAF
jgi:N-acetyl-gamma-glutamyl-phosphate reductase